MASCTSCGTDLPEQANFCPGCGIRLVAPEINSNVRDNIFEVIVRQAMAGAPWRELLGTVMLRNNITEHEVEAEVARRQAIFKNYS